MKKAIYPGSFDPITLGHLDIIKRAASLCDELVIGVLVNSQKKPLFSVDERVKMISELVSELDNVTVSSFSGLTVDFAREIGANGIVRGLRAVTDFENEIQLAQTNKVLYPDIETVFLTTSLQYSYLSSTVAKEIASYHGDISLFVPKEIIPLMEEKYK